MTSILLLLIIPLLLMIEMIYIQLARKYRILPTHQEQSSRSTYIVTGAGILFFISWIFFFLLNEFQYPIFTFGLLIVTLLFFIDDITPFHPALHVAINLIALTILFVQFGVYEQLDPLHLSLMYLVGLYILHMFHFMNRINGMTGIYALSFFVSMILLSPPNLQFDIENPLYFIVISLGVFGLFNFRKKAAAFAGDVGVYSIAYLVLFFLLQLVFGRTNFIEGEVHHTAPSTFHFEPKYLLFLSVYFVETILTFFFSVMHRKNIFTARSNHLYQYFSHKLKISHLLVATSYATLQLLINFYVINNDITPFKAAYILAGLTAIYLFLKPDRQPWE